MQQPWETKLRSFVVVEMIKDLSELADKFRKRAAVLRHDAVHKRFKWLWSRDRMLIEAHVWDEAAKIVDNTVILERKDYEDYSGD